jgi:hypothetical protein
VVLADSRQIPGVRRYSGTSSRHAVRFSSTGLSPSAVPHPNGPRLTHDQCPTGWQPRSDNAPQPHTRNPCQVPTRAWFSLLRVRSPLLTESLLFSLPAGTEMFHFPAFPPTSLCIQLAVTPHHWCRVSPFGHPGITARLTAPPGLSRPPTSFIGSWCQGIHRAPLTT